MKTANEKLKKVFTASGFDFRQMKRKGNWALYEKRRGGSVSYEVIKIRSKEETKAKIQGKVVTFKGGEYYPSTTEFGDFGWAFMELRNALQEYGVLVNEN